MIKLGKDMPLSHHSVLQGHIFAKLKQITTEQRYYCLFRTLDSQRESALAVACGFCPK